MIFPTLFTGQAVTVQPHLLQTTSELFDVNLEVYYELD